MRLSCGRYSTHHHKKNAGTTNSPRKLSTLERAPSPRPSLTSYPQVPPHRKREEQPVTPDITRPFHALSGAFTQSQTSDGNLVPSFLTCGGSFPSTLPQDPVAFWYGLLFSEHPSRKLAVFILTSCGHSVVFTRRDFLPFLTDTFACHPTDLSTPGRPDLTRSLCIARETDVSMQTPCSAFISSRENHSATRISIPSILHLSTRLQRLLICIFLLSPESRCPGRLVPPGLFHLTHFLFTVLVQIQVLGVPALYHLPHLSLDELRASYFFSKTLMYSQRTRSSFRSTL